MIILAIETSCDETAIAIVKIKKVGKKTEFKILSNEISSQIEIHKEYGGVFPMLAKREHIKNLPLVLEKSIKKSKIKIEKIDKIAVTTGPGLEPALWTGIAFAKELNQKYEIPIIPVNHMEGHIFSIFPKNKKTFTIENKKENFPMLTLLVSGGHTELVLIKDFQKYKKIGQTRDDAAGEAFDKVARMLGLSYPGGPEISKLANTERSSELYKFLDPQISSPTKTSLKMEVRPDHKNSNNSLTYINLPRPMIYSKNYDFSFSGLKTAVLYLIRDLKEKKPNILDDIKIKQKIAREFEDSVIETLTYKTIKAIKEYKIKTLIVGGGVSANSYLQKTIKDEIKKNKLKTKTFFPIKSLTGDNALMIAIAGYYQKKNKKKIKNIKLLKAEGNLSL